MVRAKMTPEEFDNLKCSVLADNGVQVVGRIGEVSKMGVGVHYEYDGTTLKLQVIRCPFVLTRSFCEGRLGRELEERGFTLEA